WSFEAAGSRAAVPAQNLQHVRGDEWKVVNGPDPEADPESVKRLVGQQGEAPFTVFQVSLFFSIYVFFQVWNQINCRSLTPQNSERKGGSHGHRTTQAAAEARASRRETQREEARHQQGPAGRGWPAPDRGHEVSAPACLDHGRPVEAGAWLGTAQSGTAQRVD